jgi:hypothetical protein
LVAASLSTDTSFCTISPRTSTVTAAGHAAGDGR